MNRYQPTTPRTLIGITAFAFSAVTIAVSIVLPATVGSGGADAGASGSARSPATFTAAAPDFRLRVDVVGVRRPDIAAAEATGTKAKCDGQG